jgi:mannose-1-phosphate guanylyltransferase
MISAFKMNIETAIQLADAGSVVVLGTKMKYASEGFGYIKALETGEVLESTEKPDILTT